MLMAADVVGALLVPTLAARLLDKGTAAMSFHAMTVTALQMIAASLDMSVFDFRQLGTASMVTRTMSDVVNIQVAITDVIMMMLPVPFIFVVALTFAFSLGARQRSEQSVGGAAAAAHDCACIPRRPGVLIFDEATSSVDTRTEQAIAKAMDALMANRTSFVIAHRLSAIRDADLILYMKHGDILEHGTHEQLLAKDGAYANLCNSQFA